MSLLQGGRYGNEVRVRFARFTQGLASKQLTLQRKQPEPLEKFCGCVHKHNEERHSLVVLEINRNKTSHSMGS